MSVFHPVEKVVFLLLFNWGLISPKIVISYHKLSLTVRLTMLQYCKSVYKACLSTS